mmetsp:Transcript_52341/g.117868  ORF Transcript_52341/g.117868 Transcript_52341/m.117868 type:complete len:517 (-) Transcript_52341:135-1685(-)|eukprot:CAMPEP_0197887934 /NCGR_PEP_ID=MMETSP1439-20131203/20170_1 /TAXON_ID=66791 /ORGANISM="Gonyaulax spinifera, Strain CCMP409" /LENGTH=516 /DNA_ID=CAMNT_0043507803 /DNA_START=60 /DNA_END=1610 /DNA_ORIENTATION=+
MSSGLKSQLPPWWKEAALGVGVVATLAIASKYAKAKEDSKAAPAAAPAAVSARKPAAADAAKNDEIIDIKAMQALAVDKYVKDVGASLKATVSKEVANSIGEVSKFLAFKPEFKTKFQARPDVGEGVLLKVTDWKLLTPESYDRTCFHFEVDIKGTNIEHLCNGAHGKALSVYATNDTEKVALFIKEMGLNPQQIVSAEDIAPPDEDGTVVLTTVEKLFTQYLDIFGKPTREFLKKLFPFAQDIQEKVAIAELTLDRKMEEFQDRQLRSLTFADYITEFKSLKIPADKYTELIPTVKQRVYSICSSSDLHPGKCQLLVVREDWQAKGGDTKFGLCSSFLTFIKAGKWCVGHSTHSVMQIPEDKMAPVFMAGLGTGLAPFRAFVEQRKFDKNHGHKVGPMTLFFGGRYSRAEYYYRDEFEAYEKEGLVKCCNAWSRDTAKKIYVQHKILEEADSIWQHLGAKGSKGYFFLCGSKQPEKDVFAALLEIFRTKGNMSDAEARKLMDQLQADGRYVTEVY